MITKQEYQQLLQKHDWFFRSSDDYRSYDKGLESERKLRALARENEVFMALYAEMENKYFPKILNISI